VFIADGGGWGSTSSGPSFTGTQTLSIEPSAIPEALKAFRVAHERVERKVAELGALKIQPWASDPASEQAAMQFAERSIGGGTDSAAQCLLGYRDQLQRACDSLQQAHEQYTLMEGDNSALWGVYD
jgi:hypothetical protein